MAVFADQAIGVGVGLLKTGQQTEALVGNNVTIDVSGSGDVIIAATTTENQVPMMTEHHLGHMRHLKVLPVLAGASLVLLAR